jgi:ParB family chromosome partitioning protein
MREIADVLGRALGTDVRVRPRGTGYKVELGVASAEDALALARRLGATDPR